MTSWESVMTRGDGSMPPGNGSTTQALARTSRGRGNVTSDVTRATFLLPLVLIAALAEANGRVVVEVRHDGKPVLAANVTLDDGKKKQDALLDPSSKGDATFADVRPGSLKVTVRYRAKGADAAPVTQIFDAKPTPDAPAHVAVALPEAAETLGASEPLSPPGERGRGEGKALPPARGDSRATGGFNLVGTLFALIVGGGVAAGLWYFIKKNPETVGGTLEKLGAQIPKPGNAPLADPPVAAAPAPLPPEPPQKIVLDAPPAPISLAASPPPTGEPSLVNDAGLAMPLAEGETTVGRDLGLGLSLAGETTVSRRHARIVRTGSAATLFDDGSTNGTFVNGQKVTGSADLKSGDAVQFGSVRFRYEG